MTEFSKEQNKLSISTVYHNYCCYRTTEHRAIYSKFSMRLLSKIVVICHNYNHSWRLGGMINYKLNLNFHNIFIYKRVTFNNRVACCVDFIRDSWRPVKASCKEFRKISDLKIRTSPTT